MLLISMVIIANVLSFIGQVSFTSSSLLKKKKSIVFLQSINHLLCSIAMLLTKAFSGMVQDATQFVKNIVLLFVPEKCKKIKLTIAILSILCGVVVGIIINVLLSGNVWYGYLPVIATAMYSTLLLLTFQMPLRQETSELIIKSGLILNCGLWLTYAFITKLYVVVFFNSLIVIMSVISVVRIIINKKKKNSIYYVK